MKRILVIILSLAVTVSGAMALFACGDNSNDDKIDVVVTIFPEYDWVKQIVGDETDSVNITYLLGNGGDLHSYSPSASDIVKISTCDLFIYVGGESDSWVDAALKNATNKNMVVLNLLDIIGDGVKEEEVVDGMQGEDEDHDHDHGDEDEDEEDHDHDDEDEEEPEYDEHVWLSVKNAKTICAKIAEGLASLLPEKADEINQNASAYDEKLTELDGNYATAVANGSKKTVLFGDRFPFRYLVDDYDLDYYAAFVGCSSETEASVETIAFLANKVNELGLSYILTIEGDNNGIAETIKNNTSAKNQTIAVMDSMQSCTKAAADDGRSYLSVMTSNLTVLTQALA